MSTLKDVEQLVSTKVRDSPVSSSSSVNREIFELKNFIKNFVLKKVPYIATMGYENILTPFFKHVAEEKLAWRSCKDFAAFEATTYIKKYGRQLLVYEREPHNALNRYDSAACQCLSRW